MKKLLFVLMLTLLPIGCKKAQSIDELIEKNTDIDTFKVVEPYLDHGQVNKLITQLISRYHYRKVELNDSLSSVIFDNYIKMLDYNRVYFLKSDIDEFEKYRNQFDDYLVIGVLDPAYDIFNRFKTRLTERIKYVENVLDTEFDFSKDESVALDRTEAEWASSAEELDNIWRKRLKNEALRRKLDGKEWDDIAKALKTRYERYHRIVLQYDGEDVFQLYMNSYADAIDPHTNYFSPMASDNFDIDMSLSLEGIGAELTSDMDYTKVNRIIPGGPADKTDELHKDDKIVAVGQGEEGEMIDVVGWRLDDVVKMIRGEKGTLVRLEILPAESDPNMPSKEIKIIRDKVKLEDQSAKSEIIMINNDGVDYKLGVIDVPGFYIDFEAQKEGDPNYKSTTRDVKKLLTELKKEKVDGVVIDLRANGGGSLQEAIELTGLFIETGPVVQVRSSNGKIDVGTDPDPGIVYDGPLAVMTNRFSASASEIFSGAIQDYGRGLIIGETTYGKGTVQNLIDLNMFIRGNEGEKEGKVKMTIAKYYRITGSSTQNMGVVPDISYPSPVDPEEYGESSQPSALPWDQIQATAFTKFGNVSKYLPELREKHEARIKNNIEFQYMVEDIAEYKEMSKKTEYSLNYDKRKAEREKAEEKDELRDEARQDSTEITVIEKGEVTKKNLMKDDPTLEETGHILSDYIALLKNDE